MMENYWKTEDLIKNFPEASDLGDLINAISSWTQSRGRVVCSISVNGIKLKEEEEGKFAAIPIKEIQEIKTESQTPELLLDESLLNCREHLTKLIKAYEQISVLLREKNLAHAHRYHRFAVEALQQFFELIRYYRILHQSARGDMPAQWAKLEERVPLLLSEILQAYEKKDYTLTADLLEYDMLNLLEEWDTLINQFCDTSQQSPEIINC